MSVAQAILAQLGGAGRLVAMVGAKNLLSHSANTYGGDLGSLSFHMKARGPNYVLITLMGDDTYTVTAAKIRNYDLTKQETTTQVYADQLVATLEKMTGLAFRL